MTSLNSRKIAARSNLWNDILSRELLPKAKIKVDKR